MAGKQSLIDPALQQLTVAYSASTSEIKDDIAALAGCWRTGHGQLPKVGGLMVPSPEWQQGFICHRATGSYTNK
jgi:hypothetical protein